MTRTAAAATYRACREQYNATAARTGVSWFGGFEAQASTYLPSLEVELSNGIVTDRKPTPAEWAGAAERMLSAYLDSWTVSNALDDGEAEYRRERGIISTGGKDDRKPGDPPRW